MESDLSSRSSNEESLDTADHVAVWNLSGAPGSGKTTAARLFAEAGIPIVDADEIARDLMTEGGRAHDELLSRFGTADPAEVRKIYFENPQAAAGFFAVLAPMVLSDSLARIQAVVASHAERDRPLTIVYAGTLPVEPQRFPGFAGFIEVEAPAALRTQRLVDRDGIEPEVAAQLGGGPPRDPRATARTLDNGGSLEELRARVLQLAEALKQAPSNL